MARKSYEAYDYELYEFCVDDECTYHPTRCSIDNTEKGEEK